MGESGTNTKLIRRLQQQFVRLLPRGRFARAVAVLAGGTAVAQVVNLVAAPLLTRIYRPQDLGVLAVYSSLLSIGLIVASLRYELAIPLPGDDKLAADTTALCMLVLLVTTGVSLIAALAFGRQIANVFHTPALSGYMWLLPVGLLTGGGYQVLYYWTLRRRGFRTIARTRVNQSISRSVVQTVWGLVSIGPLGLLVGQIVGGAAGSTTLARANRDDWALIRSTSRKGLATAGRRYSRFPRYSVLSGLLNTIGLQTTPLFMAAIYGPAVAGWYGLMERVIGLPMMIVGVAVGETYLSVAPSLARQDPGALKRLFMNTSSRLLMVGAVPAAALAILGPRAFAVIFGRDWQTAGLFAAILAPALLLQFAVSPMTQTANILERQIAQLVLDASRFIAVAAVFVITARFHLSSTTAVIALSAVLTASYAIWFIVYYHLVSTNQQLADANNDGLS